MTDPMERVYSEVATKVVALLQARLIDVEVCQKSIRFLGRVEIATALRLEIRSYDDN